jgi:hypothetical protein
MSNGNAKTIGGQNQLQTLAILAAPAVLSTTVQLKFKAKLSGLIAAITAVTPTLTRGRNQVNRSNSESSSSSGFSKTNNSSDNYSVINSTWDNTTTDGKTVGSNSRDVYSEANSNANSSYDDGKSKNTSNRDTYTVNHSQETIGQQRQQLLE